MNPQNEDKDWWYDLMIDPETGNVREGFFARDEGDWGIWVPPPVKKGTMIAYTGRKVDSILYPIPEKWKAMLPVTSFGGVNCRDLEEAGWRKRKDTKGLLKDCLTINVPWTPDKFDRHKFNRKVIALVEKWGPLWVCNRHAPHCLWSPDNFIWEFPRFDGTTKNVCSWEGREPIYFFWKYLRPVRAVSQLVYFLEKKNPPVKEIREAWKLAGYDGVEDHDVSAQRLFLTDLVNLFLSRPGGPFFQIQWGNPSSKHGDKGPTLAIHPGLGFYRSLWLQVAQMVSSVPGIYVCSICGKPFVAKRKRPEGKNHYCSRCGERGRKKWWAQKKRRGSFILDDSHGRTI